MTRTLVPALLFVFGAEIAVGAEAPLKRPKHGDEARTTGGIRYAVWPGLPATPAPVLFVLAGSIEDTLGSSYFRQAGEFLAADGAVCVSIDLPCHGADSKKGESGIPGWRVRCDRGEDFVADAASRLSKVLDHLMATKLVDPARVAVLGTSRGGFIAAHFAARDERVRQMLVFAPVTDLAALREFSGAESNALVQGHALKSHAEALAGRPLWVVIGDRDDRVGTDAAIGLARAVTAASLKLQRPAGVDLHVIAEPKGHTVPAGYAALAAEWLRRQWQLPARPAP